MTDINVNLPDIPEDSQQFLSRIFGPAAEIGDLLSEKINFYRWKSSLATINRAKLLAYENGIDPREIPLKTIVPLLEKASLEPEGSDLIDRWAALLATASKNDDEVETVYIDILSRLSALEVDLLESFISRDFLDTAIPKVASMVSKSMSSYIYAVSGAIHSYFVDDFREITFGKGKEDYCDELGQFVFGLDTRPLPFQFLEAGVNFSPFAKDDMYASASAYIDNRSLDICCASDLLAKKTYNHHFADGHAFISIVVPTALGVDFVRCCRGDKLSEDIIK